MKDKINLAIPPQWNILRDEEYERVQIHRPISSPGYNV